MFYNIKVKASHFIYSMFWKEPETIQDFRLCRLSQMHYEYFIMDYPLDNFP